MVSFATHFLAFIFLFTAGTRRLLFTFYLFLSDPPHYRSKPWHFSEPRWKNIDMYIFLVALPIASFSHIFLFLAISGHPSYRFSFLQQSFVIFLFWALIILIVLKESLDLYHVPESFVFICGGICFIIEYYMNGNGIIGLASVGYEILGGLAVVCAACCLYLSLSPMSFFADFLLSSGLVLKGTWVLQVGLSFYTDAFGLKGCDKIVVTSNQGNAESKCELEEDKLRGIALMHLIFIGHVIVVLIACFVLFGILHRNKKMRCGETNGPLLAQIGSKGLVMNPLPEFEIE